MKNHRLNWFWLTCMKKKTRILELFSTLLKNGSPLKFTLKRFGIFAWKMAVLNHCVDLHELHELIYILAKITPRPPFMLIQKRCGNWVVYIPQFYFMQICFYEIFQLASIWIKALKNLSEYKYISWISRKNANVWKWKWCYVL